MMNAFKLASGILSLCFWFSSAFFWWYLDANRPTMADPSGGRTYSLHTHGSVVYLTSNEQHLLYGLISCGIVFFLLTVAIYWVLSPMNVHRLG